MTTFKRSGFLRISQSGNVHEVKSHLVERDDWNRVSSSDQDAEIYGAVLRLNKVGKSATSLFINPNAVCPVCGAAVFLYQNQLGSKVYFDELGPPWPKHPCTSETLNFNAGHNGVLKKDQPEARSKAEWSQIQDLSKYLPIDQKTDFWEKYRTSQWNAFEIAARLNLKKAHILVLEPIESESKKKVYMSAKRFPKALSVDDVVFEYKNWISFFDTESFSPIEIEIKKLKTASAVVNLIVASQTSRKKLARV